MTKDKLAPTLARTLIVAAGMAVGFSVTIATVRYVADNIEEYPLHLLPRLFVWMIGPSIALALYMRKELIKGRRL
jgi:hypothetical protein